MIERYVDSAPKVDWDVAKLSRNDKQAITSRLKFKLLTNEKQYQAAIAYMHMKYPDLMDRNPDGMNLQWLYSPHKRKIEVDGGDYGPMSMYALIGVDPARDDEPVIFGGSYFSRATVDPENGGSGEPEVAGMGYVLFTDPDYRRMRVAQNAWYQEVLLYNEIGIKWQREIQNSDSLKVTQSLFTDPSQCLVTAWGRKKLDGTYAGIRVLMNYQDQQLLDNAKNMQDNFYKWDLIDPSSETPFKFMEREGLSMEQLIAPWEGRSGEVVGRRVDGQIVAL